MFSEPRLDLFDDFEQLERAHGPADNYALPRYPPDLIAEIAEAINHPYEIELFI